MKIRTIFMCIVLLLSYGCLEESIKKDFSFRNIISISILPFKMVDKSGNNPFNVSTNCYDDEAADRVAGQILDSKVTVVDRSHLESVIEEQKFSISGLMEEGKFSEIGTLSKVDYLVVGYEYMNQNDKGYYYIYDYEIKMIEVKTGNVVYIAHEQDLNDLSYSLKGHILRD